MASRRRRRRRSWSYRLRDWLILHRDSAVRAALGAALLLGVWVLWPDAGDRTLDRGGAGGTGGQPAADASLSDRLVAAAQASVAVSAKRQLAGEPVVVQSRLKQRLRQVARTMPDIGIPGQPIVARAAPAERRQPVEPNIAAPSNAPSVPSARATGRAAGPDPLPEVTAAGRAGLPAPPATAGAPPAREAARAALPRERPTETAPIERAAAAIDLLPPDAMDIVPGAPPAAPDPADRSGDGPIAALPDVPPDLLAPEPGGRRTPTWLRNAVAPVADARPAIAVVIDDLGLNRRGTAALNDLRAPLTLAFLPYATDLHEQTRAARAAGHELLVHVPMEPRTDDWPGPNALTSQLGPAELVSRLRSHLRSFRGFVGVNNHMGSLLTTDPERMAILMAELRQRDLLFLDSRTTPDSIAARAAERSEVPFAERDVFIDNELELAAVLRALAHAENIARRQGHAVAIGHPHDVTIEALERWLPTLDARGIALVPISAIVARQSCASGLVLVGNACARYAVAQSAVP